MIVITLARKPVETSVARNVLAFGTGGMNLDASRITPGEIKQVTARPSAFKWGLGTIDTYLKGIGREYSTEGRWPSNFILQHQQGCRNTGVKAVKGNRTDTRPEGDGGREDKSQWRYRPTEATRRGYSGSDGTETVQTWDCAPECPVAVMDSLSGVSISKRSAGRNGKDGAVATFGLQREDDLPRGHDDHGTASRFFKQIG